MFTKNIKTIIIVVVALVVAILVSCLVASNNDKKLADAAQQNAANAQTKIDELNKTIEELNAAIEALEKGLGNANDVAAAQAEVIKALEAAGIKLEGWNAATAVLVEKVEKLQEIAETFASAYDEHETLTFADVYDVAAVEAVLAEASVAAIVELARATSVESMDAILADYEATLDAIPTRLETLYANIDAITADGVAYGEKEALDKAYEEFYALNGNVFAPATETELGEKEVIYNTLNDLYVEWRNTVVAEFVANVAKIPSYYAILDTDKEVIEAARATFEEIAPAYNTPMFGDETAAYEEAIASEEVVAAIETLEAAEKRCEAVAAIRANADAVNALIDPEFVIGANVASHDYVRGLEAAVEGWTLGKPVGSPFGVASLTVVTDPESEQYNETIYNFVNHEAINAAVDAYEAAVAEISASFKAFIEAVDAIGEVTLDSEAALDAALEAYFTCLDTVDKDAHLFDTLVDAEEGHGLDYYYAKYYELRIAYENLVAKESDKNDYIKSINDQLHTLLNCTTNGTTHTCGALRTNVTYGEIDVIEAMFVALRETYDLGLEVLNADYVALYVEARLIPVRAELEGIITDALETYIADNNVTDATVLAELQESAADQIAYAKRISHEGYNFWTQGEDGTWTVTEDTAAAAIRELMDLDFINAQFNAINK